jgi:hypothetical protein
MRFWTREVAGWLLVALGLIVFYLSFAMLMARQIVGAGSLTMIGIFVFRGGIHLLKVAVAARICTQTEKLLQSDRAPAPARAAVQRPTRLRRP